MFIERDIVKNADIARFARFAERVWNVEKNDAAAMAAEGVSRYRSWVKSLELPMTFAELGADPKDIPTLVSNLSLNGNTLGAFMPLGERDVTTILEACVK